MSGKLGFEAFVRSGLGGLNHVEAEVAEAAQVLAVDAILVQPNDKILQPDGSRLHRSGKILEPDDTRLQPDAILVQPTPIRYNRMASGAAGRGRLQPEGVGGLGRQAASA